MMDETERQSDGKPSTATPPPLVAQSNDPALSLSRKLMEGKIIEILRTIYDPEIPVNIYDLGLIYDISVSDDNAVEIRMTLTAPGCPVAGDIVAEVHAKLQAMEEVKSAEVDLVWDPPWSRDMMSDAAQLDLGLM